MTQKILVTGSRGLIGRYLSAIAGSQPKFEIISTRATSPAPSEKTPSSELVSFDFLGLSEDELARKIEALNAGTIVHLAAMSNVDECEKKPEEAFRYNTEATAKLHRAARRSNARFIFASTNAVYCGKKAPYAEDAPREPLHAYGRNKCDAENAIFKAADGVVLRFILSMGWQGADARENPLTQILRTYAQGNRKLKMVTDVYANTLYAKQAAEAILRVVDLDIRHDVFNIAGGTRQNRFEFADSVRKSFELDGLDIEAVSSTAFQELIPRPKDTTFDCSKMKRVLGIEPMRIEDALSQLKKDGLAESSRLKP